MSGGAVRPLVLFAHGAGAPSTSAWMQAWAQRLEALGDVVLFDYPYVRAGRKAPDRLPALVAAHAEALGAARARHGGARPIVLAGKSMGGRVGCHLAVALAGGWSPEEAPAAVVCFGYPLRAAASGALRDDVLRALATPVLFVQGERDRLCPLGELEAVRAAMKAPSTLHVVPGGDHSLAVGARARAGRSQEAIDAEAAAAVARFFIARRLAPA